MPLWQPDVEAYLTHITILCTHIPTKTCCLGQGGGATGIPSTVRVFSWERNLRGRFSRETSGAAFRARGKTSRNHTHSDHRLADHRPLGCGHRAGRASRNRAPIRFGSYVPIEAKRNPTISGDLSVLQTAQVALVESWGLWSHYSAHREDSGGVTLSTTMFVSSLCIEPFMDVVVIINIILIIIIYNCCCVFTCRVSY